MPESHREFFHSLELSTSRPMRSAVERLQRNTVRAKYGPEAPRADDFRIREVREDSTTDQRDGSGRLPAQYRRNETGAVPHPPTHAR